MKHRCDSCTYRLFINTMASEGPSTFIIGNIGPNISSCITGSVGLTSTKIVGLMNLSDGSVSPPTAILPLFRKDTSRLVNVQIVQEIEMSVQFKLTLSALSIYFNFTNIFIILRHTRQEDYTALQKTASHCTHRWIGTVNLPSQIQRYTRNRMHQPGIKKKKKKKIVHIIYFSKKAIP
jgi:hypothetical protein